MNGSNIVTGHGEVVNILREAEQKSVKSVELDVQKAFNPLRYGTVPLEHITKKSIFCEEKNYSEQVYAL